MKKILLLLAIILGVVAPQQVSASWSNYTIVLDPGHGGDDPGACQASSGVDNYTESWLVLQCAGKVYNKLAELGADVKMTRFEDNFSGEIDLSPRRAFCYTYNSDVFVSFHLNAANASAHGTETWYYYDGSYNLASYMQPALMSEFGKVDGTGGYEMIDRGIKNNGWTVITAGEEYPSVLTEGLFIDCYSDWQLIQDTSSAGFYAWVDGHIKGIYDYLDYCGYYSVAEPEYYNGGGGGNSGGVSNPYISVSSNKVYLTCVAGKTATAKVTVDGNLLNQWTTVGITDKSKGIFSVTPGGLNVSGSTHNFDPENPELTITFTPSEVGSYSGDNDGDGYEDYVITLHSIDVNGNDVYQWITLSGLATAPPLSFTEKWNFSDKANTLTAKGWDAGKVRNMDYYNGKLYMVYEQSVIKVVDARTGEALGDLSNKGIEGGIINLCDVRAFNDKIVACNIGGTDGSGNTYPLRIYVWDNDTSDPRLIAEMDNLADYDILRLGDYIEVGGDWNSGRFIFAHDNYGKIDGVTGGSYIVEYAISNGVVSTTPTFTPITTDGSTYLPTKSSIRVYPTWTGYMLDSKDSQPTKLDGNGTRVDYIVGYNRWGNGCRQFTYDGKDYAFISSFNEMSILVQMEVKRLMILLKTIPEVT